MFFRVTALRPLRSPRLCVPLASRASRYTDLSLVLWPSAKHGEKRERRHGEYSGVIVLIVCIILPCPPYSVLGESNKCEKGTQSRRGRRGRRACVMGSVITLPLVVALVIALSFEAIRQLPSASVFDPQRLLRQGACARGG